MAGRTGEATLLGFGMVSPAFARSPQDPGGQGQTVRYRTGPSHEVRRLQVAAVVEAGDAEWSQVEAGFGALSHVGDDIAHDGREPKPVPAHPGGDDETARPAATVDDG